MNKKTIIIVVAGVIVLLLLGLGVYLKKSKPASNQASEEASSPADKLIESVTKGTLPSLETNPLENKPDLNPADKANPFTDIKTNPFK